MQQNQGEIKITLKRSQVIFIGSLLVFLGIVLMSRNYIAKMKMEVFTQMRVDTQLEDSVTTPLPSSDIKDNNNNNNIIVESEVDYSKYLGVLEIPKIGLKRGFYNIDSKLNDIEYNVALVQGSNLPDVDKGNLILMAHSGNALNAYFEKLYYLKVSDKAIVTYGGEKYTYELVNTYNVEKNGHVKIVRDYDKTILTLITCTRGSDTLQTVYVFELL